MIILKCRFAPQIQDILYLAGYSFQFFCALLFRMRAFVSLAKDSFTDEVNQPFDSEAVMTLWLKAMPP